jgi:hypothetical protein
LEETKAMAAEMREMTEANMKAAQGMAQLLVDVLERHEGSMKKVVEALTAPKKVVRDDQGRIVRLESGGKRDA